jgi:hypothetical protein
MIFNHAGSTSTAFPEMAFPQTDVHQPGVIHLSDQVFRKSAPTARQL